MDLTTQRKIFEETEWLTSKQINEHQKRLGINFVDVRFWKQSARVFSIFYDGREYYAKYQFDPSHQPLPVIEEILEAYGQCADTWPIAAWFHFPNGWILESGTTNTAISPKNSLDQRIEVIRAAFRRKGTYIA